MEAPARTMMKRNTSPEKMAKYSRVISDRFVLLMNFFIVNNTSHIDRPPMTDDEDGEPSSANSYNRCHGRVLAHLLPCSCTELTLVRSMSFSRFFPMG